MPSRRVVKSAQTCRTRAAKRAAHGRLDIDARLLIDRLGNLRCGELLHDLRGEDVGRRIPAGTMGSLSMSIEAGSERSGGCPPAGWSRALKLAGRVRPSARRTAAWTLTLAFSLTAWAI